MTLNDILKLSQRMFGRILNMLFQYKKGSEQDSEKGLPTRFRTGYAVLKMVFLGRAWLRLWRVVDLANVFVGHPKVTVLQLKQCDILNFFPQPYERPALVLHNSHPDPISITPKLFGYQTYELIADPLCADPLPEFSTHVISHAHFPQERPYLGYWCTNWVGPDF